MYSFDPITPYFVVARRTPDGVAADRRTVRPHRHGRARSASVSERGRARRAGRVDRTRTVGGGVGLRLGRSLRLTLIYDVTERTSSELDRRAVPAAAAVRLGDLRGVAMLALLALRPLLDRASGPGACPGLEERQLRRRAAGRADGHRLQRAAVVGALQGRERRAVQLSVPRTASRRAARRVAEIAALADDAGSPTAICAIPR